MCVARTKKSSLFFCSMQGLLQHKNNISMKSKELIRLLQDLDPTGEEECCIENLDIHFVTKEPANYDGPYQVLVRDQSKVNCYDIMGVKYVSKGDKIQFYTLSAEAVIYYDPEVLIDTTEAPKKANQVVQYKENKNQSEFATFLMAVQRKVLGKFDNVAIKATQAWDRHKLSYKTKFPAFESGYHESYFNKRDRQWKRELKILVNVEENDYVIEWIPSWYKMT